jgi:GT2 family glycosyltransferase
VATHAQAVHAWPQALARSETLPYSIVIATYERADRLRDALASVARQTRLPEQIIIVDSSAGNEARAVAAEFALPILYERAERPSAAQQRNQGSLHIQTPLLAFMDDDVVLAPEVFEKLCTVFESDPATGGVAARMNGATHRAPRGALWWYYRLQAGFRDETYGGRLFGPAINCFPCYERASGDLVPADWLNLGCVLFDTAAFQREKFPAFDGYSHMEDVHLSARIGRTHRLFFHTTAHYDHFPSESPAKSDRRRLAQMRMRNQQLVARDVMGVSSGTLRWKMLLHRFFTSIFLLRFRPVGWKGELVGIWS